MTELDTFVQKFYQLWNAGHSDHLDVDTHGGQYHRARRSAARLANATDNHKETSQDSDIEEIENLNSKEIDDQNVEDKFNEETSVIQEHPTTEEVKVELRIMQLLRKHLQLEDHY